LFSLENSFSNIVCGPDFAAAFGTLAVMLGTSSTAICRDLPVSRGPAHLSFLASDATKSRCQERGNRQFD
jgi:hypothetical protein